MTKEELKSKHPELYSEIYGDGQKAGEVAERNRTKAWLAFYDTDKETVVKAIKEGTEFTSADMAEMAVKMNSKKEVTDTEEDSPDDVTTDAPKGGGKEKKEVEAFDKEVRESLNVKDLV